jgi:PBP1b-binding outer membrane lipoprotein LpoB
MNKIISILIVTIFLVSCGSVKEAGKVLRNEKVTNTDEFLIKKRDPLVLPPDYRDIPEPSLMSTKQDSDEEKIKKILKSPQTEAISKSKASSVENSIINRIGK